MSSKWLLSFRMPHRKKLSKKYMFFSVAHEHSFSLFGPGDQTVGYDSVVVSVVGRLVSPYKLLRTATGYILLTP